jgi:hypothetical protein
MLIVLCRVASRPFKPRLLAGHAAYRENSHGASHLTAIRNAPPAGGCSTRKTSPAASSGRALGKRRVTSIFERRGISVSHRSRRPWVLTFCTTVSTSLSFPPGNLTKAGCRIGYLRSLRRSSRNMDQSPGTGVHALRLSALSGFLVHPGSLRLRVFRSSIDNLQARPSAEQAHFQVAGSGKKGTCSLATMARGLSTNKARARSSPQR